MKYYTSQEQTAKLIELGFEKPKGWYVDGVTNNIKLYVNIDKNPMMFNYSIGELLSFLPNDFRDTNKNLHTLSIYTGELGTWEINYIGFESRIRTCEYELIDAAFEMCVKLKVEGVI
jgi:hypothetical protein